MLVDVCSQCKGVWLEHGEMEKIVGYIRGTMAPPTRPEPVEPCRERVMYDDVNVTTMMMTTTAVDANAGLD